MPEFPVYPAANGTEAWLLLQLRGRDVAAAPRRPLHIYAILDCSGSMSEAGKMSVAQRVLNQLVGSVAAAGDRLAIVTFNSTAEVVLPLTAPLGAGEDAPERKRAQTVIADITTGGGTNIEDALRVAGAAIRSDAAGQGIDNVPPLEFPRQPATGLATAIGAAAANREEPVRVALLLTDGMPQTGLGIETAQDRATLVRVWTEQRVPATLHTFGLGVDHAADFLSSLATASAGSYSFMRDASNIGRELGVVIGNASAQITDHRGAMVCVPHAIEAASTLPHEMGAEGATIRLPVFCPGYVLDIPVRLCLPSAEEGETGTPCTVRLVYRCLGSTEVTSESSTLVFGRGTAVTAVDAAVPNRDVVLHRFRFRVAQALSRDHLDQTELATLLADLERQAIALAAGADGLHGRLVDQLTKAIEALQHGEREDARRLRQADSQTLSLQSGALFNAAPSGRLMSQQLDRPEDHQPRMQGKQLRALLPVRRNLLLSGLLDIYTADDADEAHV